jgi:hypothetical protein
VGIDKTVFNAARIWKLYGTVSCKGDDTSERPHRVSKIIRAPEVLDVVPRELLDALASIAPGQESSQANTWATFRGDGHFELGEWIKASRLDAIGPEPWQGGRKWIFKTCPWNPDHTNRSAFIIQQPGGAIAAGCHHDGCHGRIPAP